MSENTKTLVVRWVAVAAVIMAVPAAFIGGRVGVNAAETAALRERVAGLEQIIDERAVQIADLRQQIADFRKEVRESFDRLDTKIDSLRNRL